MWGWGGGVAELSLDARLLLIRFGGKALDGECFCGLARKVLGFGRRLRSKVGFGGCTPFGAEGLLS